jgi:UDP-N-acetylmuramyl pentapeptide phosphotransferase/UDP-N-acetylglucosamine-1-phosphate transferase
MIAFSALGVLMPFFYYNVFGDAAKHKKIFMGDTGTLTIGFVISFLGLKLLHNEGEPPCAFCGNPLVLVIAPMIIPCFDVVRVYLGRVRNHKNPFLPDKTHIHHKLLAIGMTQRKAMLTIVGSSLLLSFLSIGLSSLLNVNLLILLGAFIFTYANILLTKLIRRRRAAMKLKELLNTENMDMAVEPVPVEVSESK